MQYLFLTIHFMPTYSLSVLGIAAASSAPAPLHFVLNSRRHRLTDLRMQICNRARIKPTVFESLDFHFLERIAESRFTKSSASFSKTAPQVARIGVNDARHAFAALKLSKLLFFLFFLWLNKVCRGICCKEELSAFTMQQPKSDCFWSSQKPLAAQSARNCLSVFSCAMGSEITCLSPANSSKEQLRSLNSLCRP